jgi:hypothetical protein
MMRLLLITACAAARVAAQLAFGPFPGVGTGGSAGWALDDPDKHNRHHPVVEGNTVKIQGDTRIFLVEDYQKSGSSWGNHKYERFDLLGKTMTFTLDLSNIPCGCISCVYVR